MSIAVGCPACGGQFRVRSEFAGRRGKCPKCKAPLDVPAASPRAARSATAKRSRPSSSRQSELPPTIPARATVAESAPCATRAEPGRQELLAELSGQIEAVTTSPAYKAAIVLVAVVMLLLPLLYVAIVVGVGYLTYLHAIHDTWIVTSSEVRGRAKLFALVVYLGPLLAGSILVLFMCKPLFARSAAGAKPRSLTRQGEPLLFAFVERLTEVVGAPCPKRIDVDCQVNASASFRRGMLSMLGNDMVLTVGLPLVAGLNLRQFAGVLAHEFGHFAQGWGMRLSYLVRTINFWFMRVVYERDEWDQRLASWSNAWDWRLGIFLYLARVCIWLTRKVLWVLMMFGHAVSGILLRQMEFDADLYETRLGGSQAFASTCRRLHVLNLATSGAMADLRHWYRESRLGDDLPRLILANVDELTPEAHAYLDKHLAESTTGWLDTHPADRDRVAHAQQESAPGIFHDERPATELFANFAALSRTATFDCYKAMLGSALKITDLHPTDQLLSRQNLENAAARSMLRYFQGPFHVDRPLAFTTGWLEPPADVGAAAEKIRQARDAIVSHSPAYQQAHQALATAEVTLVECQQAAALLDAGFKLKANLFSQPLTSRSQIKLVRSRVHVEKSRIAPVLERYERAATARMALALASLWVDDVVAKLPDGVALRQRSRQLLAAAVTIKRSIPSLLELRGAHAAAVSLIQNLEGNEQNQELIGAIRDQMKIMHRLIDDVLARLAREEYPFKHGRGKMSIAVYCAEMTPSSEDLSGQLNAGGDILDRLPTLLLRLMAQLTVAAEKAEHALGMPPLKEPQTRNLE